MKNRVHCIMDEELEVLKSFGCSVSDYSYLSEYGDYIREFTIYYEGQIVGTEESTYTEVTKNILYIKTGIV